MKILIFSDAHLHDEVVLNILEQNTFDDVLCLGDLGNKLNPAFKDFKIVKGNNDFEDFPVSMIYEFDGHKAYLCHGHFEDVENGLGTLVEKAKENGCDMAIFGHTHQPLDIIKSDIHVINPGSVMFPRNGRILIPTYIIYEDGQFTFYHAKKHTIEDLFSEKPKEKGPSFFTMIINIILSIFKKSS